MKKIQQTRRREEEHFLLLCRKIPGGERWVDGGGVYFESQGSCMEVATSPPIKSLPPSLLIHPAVFLTSSFSFFHSLYLFFFFSFSPYTVMLHTVDFGRPFGKLGLGTSRITRLIRP